MSEPKSKDKPFAISKWVVWEAYQRVKANDGAAGVDFRSGDGTSCGPGQLHLPCLPLHPG